MKRAGIFVRVSTEDQDYNNQRFHLDEIAKFRGYEIYKYYESVISAYHVKS